MKYIFTLCERGEFFCLAKEFSFSRQFDDSLRNGITVYICRFKCVRYRRESREHTKSLLEKVDHFYFSLNVQTSFSLKLGKIKQKIIEKQQRKKYKKQCRYKIGIWINFCWSKVLNANMNTFLKESTRKKREWAGRRERKKKNSVTAGNFYICIVCVSWNCAVDEFRVTAEADEKIRKLCTYIYPFFVCIEPVRIDFFLNTIYICVIFAHILYGILRGKL